MVEMFSFGNLKVGASCLLEQKISMCFCSVRDRLDAFATSREIASVVMEVLG